MILQHDVLDAGWVRLDGFMVNAATGYPYSDWDAARFARESTTADLKGVERDRKFLERLLRGADGGPSHVTPLEHHTLVFRMAIPIFARAQLDTHRKSLHINSLSGRYIRMVDTFPVYAPKFWRAQGTSNNQTSAAVLDANAQARANRIYGRLIWHSKLVEAKLFDLGVSREQARYAQLQTQYTRISVSGTLRNWLFAFLRQRLHWHAQEEISRYAYVVAAYIQKIYPEIWDIFWKRCLCVLNIPVYDVFDPYATAAEIERLRGKWDNVAFSIFQAYDAITGTLPVISGSEGIERAISQEVS